MFVIFYLLPFSTTKSDIKWFIKLPQRRYYTRTWTSMPTNYLVVQYQETVQRLKTFLFWPILTTHLSNYIQRTVCCYWHSAKQKLVICLSAIVNSWQLHGYDVDTTMMSCAHFCFVIRCIPSPSKPFYEKNRFIEVLRSQLSVLLQFNSTRPWNF